MANTLKFGNGEWYGKKDTILAYNDENSNYKPLPFNFSRASKATVVNKAGLIETVGSGEPRIDYKDDSKGALLLEPQRTNLFTYSEDFSNGSWQKVASSTITTNTVISPDSTLNASTFKASSSSYGCILRKITTFDFVSPYTISFYVKKNNYRYVGLRLGNLIGASDSYNFFDFDTETVNNTPAPDAELSFEKLTNGWYKLSLTGTPTSSTAADLALTQSNGSTINPTGTEEVYVYGAQLEQGSYATSYITTQGSTVTRLAETASQTVPDGVIGQTEGTMYVEFEFNYSDSNTQVLFKANQTTDSNSVGIEILGTTIKGLVNSQSSNIANIQGTIAIGTIKAAIAYKTNDIAFYVNGVQVGIISSGSIDFAGVVDILTIGHFSLNGGQYFLASRPFNQAQLYNTRLSNSELQALTS